MVARYEPDYDGIGQMLRSPEVQRELAKRADAVAKAAGPGMRATVYQGEDRARARVWTGTVEAKKAEAENRALTRAIDAGRS